MNLSVSYWLAKETLPVFRALHLPAEAVKQLSERRLRGVLSAASRVSLYARRMRAAGVDVVGRLQQQSASEVLRSVPAISKQELQDAGPTALKGGRIDPAWHSSISSGSTGEPLRVYYDSRAWTVLKYLVKYRARAACGLRPHHRVALLDAVAPEREGWTLLERAGRVRRISVFRPHEEIAECLTRYSPDVVYGLPSSLHEVASALGKGASSLGLSVVFTSGEFLLDSVRNHLREAYACPVYDVYGSSETKEVAWECRERALHINADVVLIEVLQENGEVAAPGDEGDIVATLLVNEAMPLIRYRTGDRGSLLHGRCACGVSFPKLGVLTGREADTLRLGKGRRISPYVLTCALECIAGLRRYQVTQVRRDGLRVQAVCETGADRDVLARTIESAIRQAIPGSLWVTVHFVECLPRGPGVKFRVVEPLPV